MISLVDYAFFEFNDAFERAPKDPLFKLLIAPTEFAKMTSVIIIERAVGRRPKFEGRRTSAKDLEFADEPPFAQNV